MNLIPTTNADVTIHSCRHIESESRRRVVRSPIPSPPPSRASPSPSVERGSLPPSGETLGLQKLRYGKHVGLTFPFDPAVIALSRFNDNDESESAVGTLRKVGENDCFIMLADDIVHDYAGQIQALDAVEQVVAPHGPALLAIYFRTVHPSFPVVQKHAFLDQYASADRHISPPLLACMYMLALNWWSHDPALSTFPKPDARALLALASQSLGESIERPRLSTVQAGLLFLQRPDSDSWSLTTQLVAVGQELGLHLDCSNWTIPAWERALRKRLAWALYMQDKWSSLIHGRPSHLFAANWAVRPIDQDDIFEDIEHSAARGAESEADRAERETGQLVFAQMISLTTIMAEVMDTFYTQAAIRDVEDAGARSTALILEKAKPVQIKLKEWFAKLPAAVKMDNVTASRLTSTGQYHFILSILSSPHL